MASLDHPAGLTDTFPRTDCRFCHAARTTEGFKAESAISLSEDVFATASVGALVTGWTLVMSRHHESSSARLSTEERLELFTRASQLASWLSIELARPTVMFEHGAASETSDTACTTAHVHLHIVPTTDDVMRHALEDFPLPGSWQPVDIEELGHARDDDYLLFGTDGSWQLHVLATPVSQYFRRVIADQLGMPGSWNWREDPQLSNVEQTRRLLNRLSSARRAHT